MKYIIILGDGMADEPIPELGGKTPIQAARKPNMDRLAAAGRNGLLDTVPIGFAPGSEIANLTLLGYDVARVFEGRGSLEAASMGVEIALGEMAMRCNLITIENGKIKNHSSGHISTGEAHELIDFLQEKLGDDRVSIHPGVSYRHLLKIRGGDKNVTCTPPHDVPGTPFRDVLVRAARPEG
ncbi:MAG: phosphoglycerate mutase, partial [Rikenellaceae bacterium]|nr:phosphoglycerate mutase [Rikenellaceae bacterium]